MKNYDQDDTDEMPEIENIADSRDYMDVITAKMDADTLMSFLSKEERTVLALRLAEWNDAEIAQKIGIDEVDIAQRIIPNIARVYVKITGKRG